jgi:uncharacterized protein YjbJ (UPF0337 family)
VAEWVAERVAERVADDTCLFQARGGGEPLCHEQGKGVIIVSDTGRFNDNVDQVSGRTKEWAGRATDDRDLEREGKAQHGIAEAKENLRDAGEKVRDAVTDTAHKIKDAVRRH